MLQYLNKKNDVDEPLKSYNIAHIKTTLKQYQSTFANKTMNVFETKIPGSTDQIIWQHTHFLFVKDEFQTIRSILEQNGFTLTKDAFMDIYYDTPDLKLMKNNQWLRFRDGKWCLKIIDNQTSDLYFHTLEGDDALQYLKDRKFEHHAFENVYLQESLPVICKKRLVGINEMLKLCPRRIAHLPTNRFSFTNESESVRISMDTICVGEKYFTVGHIKMEYKEGEDYNESILRLLEENIFIPSRSKVMTYFENTESDDIKKMLSSTHFLDSSQYLPNSFQEGRLDEPCLPYNYMQECVDISFYSESALLSSYYEILEEIEEKEYRTLESSSSSDDNQTDI